MQASHLEMYNEKTCDLLATEGAAKLGGMGCAKHGAGGVTTVANLTCSSVTSEADVHALLTTASGNRSVKATKMNTSSSRSHSVFLLKVGASHAAPGQSRSGHLVLVDLAGSERIDKSGVTGPELKEALAINQSLSSLGNVIMALGKKQAHVPFRDSTLTYLLQNCLGGDSKTLMVVNVSPTCDSATETLNSLRFAAKVNATEVGVAKKHGANN